MEHERTSCSSADEHKVQLENVQPGAATAQSVHSVDPCKIECGAVSIDSQSGQPIPAPSVSANASESVTGTNSSGGSVEKPTKKDEILDKLSHMAHTDLVNMNLQMYTMLSCSVAESKELKANVARLETQLKAFHGHTTEIDELRMRCNELETLLEGSSAPHSKRQLTLSRTLALKCSPRPPVLSRSPTAAMEVGRSAAHPQVVGLPPTGTFPGKPPGPPPGARQPPKKFGSSGGLGATAASLFRHFQSGQAKESKKAETPPSKQRDPKPSHNRLALYWQAHGKENQSPTPGLQPLKQSGIKDMGAKAADQSAVSAFGPSPVELTEELLHDPNLDIWFTRHKPEIAVAQCPKPKAIETDAKGARESVLGVALMKKFGITVRCLTKAFGRWDAFKSGVLLCQLGGPEIDLLLDTVPDPESSRGTRKLHEWEEAVTKVAAFRKEHPLEPLYPDEEFVAYISSVPDLHQRLECMVVMKSFQQLLQRVETDMEVLMDAIEVLSKNSNIPKLFSAILCVGNYLNEGTALGQKSAFKLASLRKVAELRGQGPNARSLLYFLASHLGQIASPEEIQAISKAARCSIAQVVQNASRIHDIFKLLSDKKTAEETQSCFERKRRQSVRPDEDDVNDRFIEIGREFVSKHSAESEALRADVRRLLQDYYCLAEYFGDCESFIPIDRKTEDERNPGQLRFIPDIFTVFSNFFTSYQSALKDVIAEKEKKFMKGGSAVRRPKASQARAAKPQLGTSGFMRSQTSPAPSSAVASPADSHHQVQTPQSEALLEAVESSHVCSKAVDMDDARSPRPTRRASMRPSLFPETQQIGGLDQLVRLEAVKELVTGRSSSPTNYSELENIPIPIPKEATPEIGLTEVQVAHETSLTSQAKRRRESLREMAGLLTLQSKVEAVKARSGLPAQPHPQHRDAAVSLTATAKTTSGGGKISTHAQFSGTSSMGTSMAIGSLRNNARGVATDRQLSPLHEVEHETSSPYAKQTPYARPWHETRGSSHRMDQREALSGRARKEGSASRNAASPDEAGTGSAARLQRLRAEADAALRRSRERRAAGF